MQLIQKLFDEGMAVDQIAGILVEMFPELERGIKDGSERERRVMVHGLCNVWVSMWAERV